MYFHCSSLLWGSGGLVSPEGAAHSAVTSMVYIGSKFPTVLVLFGGVGLLGSLWNFGIHGLSPWGLGGPPVGSGPAPGGFACTGFKHLTGTRVSQLGGNGCVSYSCRGLCFCFACAYVHVCMRVCVLGPKRTLMNSKVRSNERTFECGLNSSNYSY